MASVSKKNTMARKTRAPTESIRDEPPDGSRAGSVSPHASEDALVSPPTAPGDFATSLPAGEAQQGFRNALEKGLTESRAVFIKARAAAEETVTAFEVSFAAAKDGALAFNAKAFEALRANADANFDFLKAVCAARSLSDVVTLQTEFGRKRVETTVSQAQDLGALAQKAMAGAVEPITEQVAKSLKIAV